MLLVPDVCSARLSPCPRNTQDMLRARQHPARDQSSGQSLLLLTSPVSARGSLVVTGAHESLQTLTSLHPGERFTGTVMSCKECCEHIPPAALSLWLSTEPRPRGMPGELDGLSQASHSPGTGAPLHVRDSCNVSSSISLHPLCPLLIKESLLGETGTFVS